MSNFPRCYLFFIHLLIYFCFYVISHSIIIPSNWHQQEQPRNDDLPPREAIHQSFMFYTGRLPLPFYIRLLTEKAHLSYTYYLKMLPETKPRNEARKNRSLASSTPPQMAGGGWKHSLLPGRNKQPILGKHMLPSAGTCMCVPHRSVPFDFNVRL